MATKREERLDGEAAVMSFLKGRIEDEREAYDQLQGRRSSTAMVRGRVFMDDLESVLKKIFPRGPVKAMKQAPTRKHKPMKRLANVAFSDLHYHALLDPREVPFQYGPIEEARRTAKIIAETMDYKPTYRGETELAVHVFGDIIQGDLHDPRDAATITEQFGGALHMMVQGARLLASAYSKVTYRCVPGNHGRNKRRHPDRATTQKWDSFENMIYLAFAYAVADLPNVKVEIPYTPYYTWKAFDKTGFITHGDTVLDVGFPSSTIDIKKIRNQINEWNAGDETYDLFMVGHVHCGSMVQIPSGATFMSNGCLIPPDGFSIATGRPNANCGMWLWESVEGFIVGDARFLKVDENTDKDASLDKLITPFHGLETRPPSK